ncbi:c-type cytochrome [Candidatus Spongiihabitans sp.]|uniref:c-type cytochrome n=1 Tax=Candidatus Spongiihabitans sp. TaxID=3101308 RepID=UPI003C704061
MCKLLFKFTVVTWFVLSTSMMNIVSVQAGEPEFKLMNGKVDIGTFNGWRRFHSTCHVCHGQDALGSSFGPNLIDSLKTMDYQTFIETVTDGRQVTSASGEVSVMPAFGKDPNVAKHLDDIYRFLTARAKGGLAPGRPKK